MPEELLPSRAALLELRDDREVMQAGQAFLDEKRTLIAATLVQMLQRHRALESRFRATFIVAADALRTALARHGLEALQAYPQEPLPLAELVFKPSELLGVALLEATLDIEVDELGGEQEDDGIRSVQGELCRRRFAELLPVAVELAALESNLRRLYEEFRKTERRASALEDVLIPELDDQLRGLEELLEAQEIEEAVRVRVKRRTV
jgi:V/A-type H+/Na+-transporting ATPase subunit D